jgi:hypothetical protein
MSEQINHDTNLIDESYVGPHELHVTVAAETTDPNKFRNACSELGVKSHIIFNKMPGSESVTDYLTGSEIIGSSVEAYMKLGRISCSLREAGLEVVREKIETTPWHPNAPKTSLDRLNDGNYFECHFTLPDLTTIHGFRALHWGGVPFLMSTTERKQQEGLLLATMRHYISTAGEFCRNVDEIHQALEQQIGKITKPTVEFSLYDSNSDHDNQWIDSYRHLQDTN